ncbi:hypothetical protein AP47_03694, partial [Mycobacterium tuberculosis H2754]
ASGKLGQHNGLPVSIVVTTTLTDLQTGAGKGFTGGGTLLPMADVIRMTSHAHHYSPASGRYPQAIFDHGTPLALYHTKRLASPAQRIMLFANDRGCTKPGCDAPAYHSQAHHVTAWTSTGRTDITDLTLACGPDNRLAEKGWTTRKTPTATPNGYHHPTSTTANPAPTPSTTPNDSSTTKTTTTNPIDPQQSKPHATTPHNHKHRVRQGLAGANTPRW